MSQFESKIFGIADKYLESSLRSRVTEYVCTTHSFGFAKGEQAFMLAGVSGSGKTTLGLALLQHGFAFMGDEFGYLDLRTGMYWHAHYPICVKKPTLELCGLTEIKPSLTIETPYGIQADVLNTKKVLKLCHTRSLAGRKVMLRGIIVPQIAPTLHGAQIDYLSIADWPKVLLHSFACKGSRSKLFKGLVGLVKDKNIEVYRLRACTPSAGSELLASML